MDNTFIIKDLGGTFSFQTSANTSCEVGSNWDSTTHRCEEVAVLPVAPTIDISASPTLVRKGKTADIAVNITSVDQLNCTIYGVDLADNTFSHNGSALPTPHNFTTKELNSAQTVKVKCEVVSAPVVVTEKEIRINVVSTGGEI